MTTADAEYDAVVEQIKQWPPARRLALVRKLVETLAAERGGSQEHGAQNRRRSTLTHAIGLFRGNGPPPSDEQIRRLREERRLEKFG